VKVNLQEKGEWYRMYTGHFKDREEAEGFAGVRGITQRETLKTEYANLLGVYSQSREFEDKVKAISDLGYSSYVVKGGDEKLKLLVGAYVTEEAAESSVKILLPGELKTRSLNVDELVRSRKTPFASFRRKPESRNIKGFWTPAFAGVTT